MSFNPEEIDAIFLSSWQNFLTQTSEATNSLIYLLEGLEFVRHSRSDEERAMHGSNLSVLNVVPHVAHLGPYDREGELGLGGRVAQLAFKGWVGEVYGFWEDHTRKKPRILAEERGQTGWINLENDIMGDLGYIRQDLLHNNSVASEANVGRCRVLRWFQPGDKMAMNLSYVLEFLHRMGLWRVNSAIVFGNHSKIANLTIPPRKVATIRKAARRRVVSFVTEVQQHPEGRAFGVVINVLFEDGIAGILLVEHSSEEEARIFNEEFNGTPMDEMGRVVLSDGMVYDIAAEYPNVAERCIGGDPSPFWGPPIRFRKPE